MLSALVGVGVLGVFGSTAALAQDNTTSPPASPMSATNQSMPGSYNGIDYNTDYDWMAGNFAWMSDPAAVNYPLAAPGAIDMYHFAGYRGFNLMPLSPTDVRYQQQMQQDLMMHRSSTDEEDESMVDPAPVSYPLAAPGQTDMFHFKSYRGIDIEPGSVEDARYQRWMQRDMQQKQQMQNTTPATSGTSGH